MGESMGASGNSPCRLLGLTPAELGEMVGVSASAVARWEAGSAEPRGRAQALLGDLLAEVETSSSGECAVGECRRLAVANGVCALHQRRSIRGASMGRRDDQGGESPSGWGLLGVVDRDAEAVLCHECGRWLGSLVQHLRQAHALTVDEYRDRHELPATTPLASEQMSQRLRETSRERIGSPDWQRFEVGRDQVTAESQRKATEASRHARLGTRAGRTETARRTIAYVHRDEERWKSRLDAVMDWWKRHGRPPARSSDDPAEVSLARWAEAQRRANRHGALTAERRAALECADIDLDPGQGVTWWQDQSRGYAP